MAAPFSRLPRPPAAGPAPAAGRGPRRFRTTADGRIPLAGGAPALFDAVRGLGEIALLTRHACARLVAQGPAPILVPCPRRRAVVAPDGALVLAADVAGRAWGRLGHCACCGSPGRIELHNAGGAEFLQFTAPPGCTAAAWADCLATVQADFRGDAPPAEPAPLPRLPREARLLRAEAAGLLPLLAALGEEEAPVGCTLATPEARHTRSFVPRRLYVPDAILSAGGGRTTVQLALPAVHALAVTGRGGALALHAVGPGRAILLTFHAAAEPGAACVWRAALLAAFPELAAFPFTA